MSKHKAFVSLQKGEVRDTFFTPRSIAALEEHLDLTFTESTRSLPKEALIDAMKGQGYEYLINGWGSCAIDGDILDAAPELKMVAYTAGSVAGIATEALYDRGVKLICGNKVFAMSVAEATVCYMMASLRKLEYYTSQIRAGGWTGTTPRWDGLFYKKIGIVGYGTIGHYVAKYLAPYDPQLYIYDKFVPREEIEKVGRYATLEELFAECDVVTLHLSRNPGTIGMINRGLLESMKPGALLVNTARGAILDEEALKDLCKAGKISAALDVYDHEPLEPDNPLRTLPNVMPLPHRAGPTIDMREVVTLELAKDIDRFLSGGELVHAVSLAYARQMTH